MPLLNNYLSKLSHAFKFLQIFLRRRLRTFLGQPIIHVVGDSHTLLFQHPLFQIHYLGPTTAYGLGSENSSTQSRQKILTVLNKLPTDKKQYLLFVLGEIDTRIHIYNTHKLKNITIEESIQNIIQRYQTFLLEIQKNFPHLCIMLFNVLPPGEQNNFYNYPFYADRNTRFNITIKINQKIQLLAQQHNFLYISAFHQLIDSQNNRLPQLIFDDIHYNDKILPVIIKEINSQLKNC